MNILNRIERLEQALSRTGDDASRGRLPIAWSEIDPATGRPLGPSSDASPAQLRTWETVSMMLASIPKPKAV